MGKKQTPEAPDLSAFAELARTLGTRSLDQQDLQLSWARDQDTQNRALLERVLGVQLPIMQKSFENAQADRERYETVFRPLEDKFIKDAKGYDTPGRRQFAQGQAVADVNSAFDAQRRNAEANLASYGVDPTTLKAGALDTAMRTAQAATQAGAATQATNRVEDTGRQLMMGAINIGQGLPAQAAAGYGQAAAVGQGAVGGANATSANSSNLFGAAGQFGNQALNAANSGANIYSQMYQNRLAGYQARGQNSPWNMVGQLGGAALGGWASGGFQMEKGGTVTEEGALPISPIPGSTDRKPAILTPGEFVVDKDTVAWKGEEFFHKLMAKVREQRMGVPVGAT